ncbi:MAG: hypothetical protein Q8P22_02125 [Chloroflexota bacterium]|nr:hypothetical protein [Chloroflexota bacterium]
MSAVSAVYFDLTPPRLVTALITEQGVFRPREIRPLSTPFLSHMSWNTTKKVALATPHAII